MLNIKKLQKNSKYSNKYDIRDLCKNIFSGIFNLENSFLKRWSEKGSDQTNKSSELSARCRKIPLMESSARLVRTTTGTCLNI